MLLTILLWVIGCIALAFLNAKFWKLMPDTESNEGNDVKAKIKPLYEPINKGKLNWMDWITIVVVLAVLFSCSPMKSGYYTIKEVRALNTVVLKEVKGDWHIPSDTLKVGDKVYLKRSKTDSLINVW